MASQRRGRRGLSQRPAAFFSGIDAGDVISGDTNVRALGYFEVMAGSNGDSGYFINATEARPEPHIIRAGNTMKHALRLVPNASCRSGDAVSMDAKATGS
jgi:hypothetical protein